jgi:hypothetical protein
VSKELRQLIFRMVGENQTWGAPRIHGELKMLGYDISERTVLRWMRKAPRGPAGEAMGGIPEQPQRGDCGDGLLHRPDPDVWYAPLLLRHHT